MAVTSRIYARLVELCCLFWLSASGRTRVSLSERGKIPTELVVPVSLYLEDKEVPSRDRQKAL